MVKNLPANAEDARDAVQSLGWEDPLEEREMATHSSILAWKIPRKEWWAAVHGVAKIWTWLNACTSQAHRHTHTHTHNAGSVMMKCLSFCLSSDAFVSPSFLKDSVAGYSIPDWHLTYVSTLYVSPYSLWLVRFLLLFGDNFMGTPLYKLFLSCCF